MSTIVFGQYEQYINLVTPYLSDSIRSGFFFFKTPNNFQPGSLYNLYRQYAPDYDNNLTLLESYIDPQLHFTHYKYQQTYKGIKVEGAYCIEHYDQQGNLAIINAKIADSINKSPKPQININRDLEKILNTIRKEAGDKIVFAWEDSAWEADLKHELNDQNATYYPSPSLIWAIDTMKNMQMIIPGYRYSLAYQFEVTIVSPYYQSYTYYIDATNGSVLKRISNLHNDGPAQIFGYGTRTIDTQWKGGTTNKFILKTNDNGRNIHTKLSANDNNIWGLIPNVKSSNDTWGNSDIVETTTHYFASNSWDYFRGEFGRDGQDNNGREIRIRTQCVNMYPPNNAYFHHTNLGHNILTFGVTSNTHMDFGIDQTVVGHEFTHGVTYHSAGLTYEYESGALNESFSDIFGVVIKAKMLENNNTNWLQGADINTLPEDIRSLKDPKNYYVHIENNSSVLGQPDTYGSGFWYSGNGDNGGVHINSGVQNKWFYLLANGDNGYNDLNNYYNVHGIGIDNAAFIAYVTLTNFLFPSSQYSDSWIASIAVAKIFWGECSEVTKSVIDAWYGVGMPIITICDDQLSTSELEDTNIQIYPNPTNDKINISLPTEENTTISIFDVTGKLIERFESNQKFITKDVSKLSNGTYLIQFDKNTNESIMKKLIIQR